MRAPAVLAGLLLLAVAGCSTPTNVTLGAGTPVSSAPDQTTTVAPIDIPSELQAVLPACPVSGSATAVDGGLPDIALACLGPGDPVRLAGLRGLPMIVNFWASWCQPCRTELPALASFSRQVDGEVLVLGVDAADDPRAGAELWSELGIEFPSVADPKSLTRADLQWIGLPVSYFVSADGVIVYRHPGQISDEGQWADLAQEYLGIG